MDFSLGTDEGTMSKEKGQSSPPEESRPEKTWTPAQANFPEEDETYPFLDSIVTMRKVKSYTNDENLLPTTTYSFIASTRAAIWSTKLVNLFVFTLQFASYIAVSVSVIDWSKPSNKCKFPANVTSAVRATQLLSMMYSILVQKGIITSLFAIRNGYNEAAMMECFPECGQNPKRVKFRWCVSLGLIFLMGLYAQLLTFIMIMQSSEVLGVLLNYAAVSFISTIDDQAFYLGKRGWFGPDVERHVRLICLADNPDPKPQWYRRMLHSLSITLIFGALLASWVYVVSSQTSGKFLPTSLKVDFSDLVHPSLGTFSGFYDIYLENTAVFSDRRAVYYERRSNKAFFGYCDKEDVWTFIYGAERDQLDACKYSAKSSPTVNFDVVTTTVSQWYGLSENGRTVPLDNQHIEGWDCAERDLCGAHGFCSDNRCVCDVGFFGRQCNFPEPCSRLQTDGRLGTFQGIDRKWSSHFEILRFGNTTATVYDKPVYVSRKEQGVSVLWNRDPDDFDIMFFTGRRWAIAFSKSFYNEETDGNFESYLANFHGYFSNYSVAFLSEPLDAINDNPSPDGLSWYMANPKRGPGIQTASSQKSSAVLLCAECNSTTNPCYYDGICQVSSECKCSDGSEGGLCEVPPIGNGRCDPYFNSVTFDMDGGDCCRATCESSNEIRCGRDPTGFLELGFFFCESNDPLPSDPINGEPFSEAGGILALSDNGFVLAAVMAEGKVGLFDKSGSQWIERTVINTCSVQAMALASGPFASNPIFLPPVVIVISCNPVPDSEDVSAPLRTYFCTRSDCHLSTLQSPPQLDAQLLTPPLPAEDSVGISNDGSVIAVSTRGGYFGSGFVDIYRAEGGSGGYVAWRLTNETIIPEKFSSASSLSPATAPDVGEIADIIFEVEDAIMVNTVIETRYCPCSGEGYADMVVGSSLEWKVYDIDAGFYEISARYSSQNDTRPLNLLVDGVIAASFEFESTPSWSDWTVERKLIELSGGNHILMLKADEKGPNIDWLSLHLVTETESPSAGTVPTASPTMVPNQVVGAISLSGSGSSIALLVGDSVDGLDVRVYLFRFDGSGWVQSGVPIKATVCSGDISAQDVIRLSYDGNTLLFSGGDIVKVFDWNGASNEWNLRGTVFEGIPSGVCRTESVALSNDGNAVALTLYGNHSETATTSYEYVVTTFSWTQSRWERREQLVLPGSRSGPLSFAEDGRELAIGLPFQKADLSGGIQTFEYPRRPCDEGLNLFLLTFTIKPKLTKWTVKMLTFDGDIFEIEGGPYFFPNFADAERTSKTHHELATVVEEICIPPALCGNLTVYPTDFGGFNVVADGVLVVELDSVDTPRIFLFGNDTSACNFADS